MAGVRIGNEIHQNVRGRPSKTAVVAAPILSKDRFLGALAIHDTRPKKRFKDTDKEMLNRLAKHAAVAIENAIANVAEQQVRSYLDSLINEALKPCSLNDYDLGVRAFLRLYAYKTKMESTGRVFKEAVEAGLGGVVIMAGSDSDDKPKKEGEKKR
jgi:hypothetical protein